MTISIDLSDCVSLEQQLFKALTAFKYILENNTHEAEHSNHSNYLDDPSEIEKILIDYDFKTSRANIRFHLPIQKEIVGEGKTISVRQLNFSYSDGATGGSTTTPPNMPPWLS